MNYTIYQPKSQVKNTPNLINPSFSTHSSPQGFIRTSVHNRCPICDKYGWCSFFADGTRVTCMHISEGSVSQYETGTGTGYVHWLIDKQSYQKPQEIFTQPLPSDRASPDICHTIYSRVFNNFSLTSNHLNNLRNRGLTDSQIRGLEYKSMPHAKDKFASFQGVADDYGNVLFTIPGFYRTSKGTLWLSGEQGIVIPCKNVDGQIVGAQIRIDTATKDSKYKWLSTSVAQRVRGGVSSGTPLHVARTTDTSEVWITEGILKADIASLKMNKTFIGIAGVSSYRMDELEDTLKKLNPNVVVIAFDADAIKKPQVREALYKIAKAVSFMGFLVQIAHWALEDGKGIDDLLVNDKQFTLQSYVPGCAFPFTVYGEPRFQKVDENISPNPINEKIDLETLSIGMKEQVADFSLNGNSGLLICATQGFGKTTQTVDVLNTLWESNKVRPIYAAPRHDLLNAVSFPEWFKVRPRAPRDEISRDIYSGQSLQFYYEYVDSHDFIAPEDFSVLCHHWERADALGKKGWSTPQNLCVTDCEIGAGMGTQKCPYFLQFKDNRPIGMVQDYLFIPEFCKDIFVNNDLLFIDQKRQVLVVDEPSPDKFFKKIEITTDDFSQAIVDAWDADPRKLWQICRDAVETVASQQPQSEKLGKSAMEAIIQAAGGLESLEILLSTVKACTKLETAKVKIAIDGILGEVKGSYKVRIGGERYFIPSAISIPIDDHSMWVQKDYAIQQKFTIIGVDENPNNHIPLNFQSDLLNVLQNEIEKFKTGNDYNSALVITPFGIRPMIRLNLKKTWSVPSGIPTIFLDGCGDANLLSKLTGLKIQKMDISIPIGCQIIQTVDGQYGKSSLWNTKQNKPTRSLIRLLDKIVFPLAMKHPGAAVIVTWKVIADYLRGLQKQGLLSPRIAIAHYGALEGTNDYEDREIGILIGTPQDNPGHLEQLANALFIEDDKISMERKSVWKRYKYTDFEGKGYESKVELYADERVEMLANVYREQEIVQAAHRTRPIRNKNRKIYLLTSLPIDSLPPTLLTTVNDLARSIGGVPEISRIDKNVAREVFKDLLANENKVLSIALKHALQQTFRRYVINNINSEEAKRQMWSTFPSDSTICEWIREFAQEAKLDQSRLVVSRRSRAQGGGATWVNVYHSEPIDEAEVRADYAILLDIRDEDIVWVESEPYENAKKWPETWGEDPVWENQWDMTELPHTNTS